MTQLSTAAATLIDLPLTAIRPSATNPRKSFDPEKLQELADSIEQQGVLQPVLVRPNRDEHLEVSVEIDEEGDSKDWSTTRECLCGAAYVAHGEDCKLVSLQLFTGHLERASGGFELVAGSRRFAATKLVAGKTTIPAMVRDMSDAEVLDVQIVENLQRADIHPADEAEGYAKLIEAAEYPSDPGAVSRKLSAADVAAKVGKPAAYVAARLKLLELGLDAKLMFVKGHLSLDHALLLARLTVADQERALMFMLDADPKYDKRPLTQMVRERLYRRGIENGTADDDVIRDEPKDTPSKAQHMHFGRKVIDATPAQLKKWIEGNVLLQLKNAPWSLSDETLVARAGGCDVCPKRSGSNAALFSELTTDDDVCLDPVCFAAKQDATVKEQKTNAKKAGGALLKLSVQTSTGKMTESAFTSVGLNGLRATAKTVRAGQWLAAVAASCGSVGSGVMVDGPTKGKVLTVCANQACKVHVHKVNGQERTSSNHNAPATPEQIAREAKRKEKLEAAIGEEMGLRLAVYDAMVARLPVAGLQVMRRLVMASIDGGKAYRIARWLGLIEIVPALPGEESWDTNGRKRKVAETALRGFIVLATEAQLAVVALEVLVGGEREVPEWQIGSGFERYRDKMWATAKDLGVNVAKVIAARSKKTSAKKVAKKATKKAPAKSRSLRDDKKNKGMAKKAAAKKAAAKKTAKKKAVK